MSFRYFLLTIISVFLCINSAAAEMPEYEEWKSSAENSFNSMDLNGNGLWTWDEYEQALLFALGPKRGNQDDQVHLALGYAKEFFKNTDQDQNDYVTLEEFLSKETYNNLNTYKLKISEEVK